MRNYDRRNVNSNGRQFYFPAIQSIRTNLNGKLNCYGEGLNALLYAARAGILVRMVGRHTVWTTKSASRQWGKVKSHRCIIADCAACALFNKKVLQDNDFIKTGIGVSLTAEGKKKVVAAYEQRIQDEIVHPIFGYKISYRRVLEVQARLLSRVLSGELEEYPAFVVR